jgi:acetate kinase
MTGDPLVLVFNSGSSSIKYQLIEMTGRRRLASGLVERVGGPGAGRLVHKTGDGEKYETEGDIPDHAAGMAAVLKAFAEAGPSLGGEGDGGKGPSREGDGGGGHSRGGDGGEGPRGGRSRLAAIGHRVVHGGDRFADPVLIDDDVIGVIMDVSPLAPLHNLANLALIDVARKTFPDVPQVAVFDTAFHQTLPPAAYTYAVPKEWRERLGVRRYGFHGTSHRYVSRRAAAMLGKTPEDVNVIVLHLGNGASAAAIAGGRSVETSMGLTPLEGLVMGTRSGDIDPALPAYLERVASLSGAAVDKALNNESGLLALAGSNDMRDVQAAAATDESASLALDVYHHRIRKYVGAYYAVLGRVDAIVFTAGIGEHDIQVRELSLSGLERLGITVDVSLNAAENGGERFVSPPGAEVAVLVIPTDEEIEIAEQALAVVNVL